MSSPTTVKRLRTPPRLAVPAATLVYGTVDVAAPVVLSFLTRRVGWNDGPSAANLLGLLPLAGGLVVILWAAAAHATVWRDRDWRILGFDRKHLLTPDYLVTDGPYRFTRNPLYVGDILMWIGWSVVLGSAAVAAGVAALALGLQVGVRLEEQGLARRFGDEWKRYAASTPRFVGRRRSASDRA